MINSSGNNGGAGNITPKRTMSSPTKRTLHFLDGFQNIFQSATTNIINNNNPCTTTTVNQTRQQKRNDKKHKFNHQIEQMTNECHSHGISYSHSFTMTRTTNTKTMENDNQPTINDNATMTDNDNNTQNITRILINSNDTKSDDGKYIN